ncbi:hypothetical protein ASR50_34690 [Streptomyces sp. 4F]|nr:hypothetical protein ASR50_00750 [Streptomyces sp. 4F]ALV54049.1 hypothetical protein ASR50_34690 [Streptomyces sp. 4F]
MDGLLRGQVPLGLLGAEFDQGELVNPLGDESSHALLWCGRLGVEEHGLDPSGGGFPQGGFVGVACVAEHRLQDAGDLCPWAHGAQFGEIEAEFLKPGRVTAAQRVGAGEGSGPTGGAFDDLAS